MWKTHGHQKQKDFLDAILLGKKYAHAYLFAGPSAVGKKTLALEFAANILGAELDFDKDFFHPDLIIWGDDKYKIEDVRTLISDLSLKPYQSEYKVAILDNFEQMTTEAANSILKTLEEPNPSTIIILVTSNRQKLLPTIVSRVQTLNFYKLSDSEFSDFLDSKGLNKELSANGKPGKAIFFKDNPETAGMFSDHLKMLDEIRGADMSSRLALIKTFAEKEGDELSKIFDHFLDQEHAKAISAPANFKNVQLIIDALGGLNANFNKKMVLEKLFLGIK
jgi:DNA polymerase III subunit delta'